MPEINAELLDAYRATRFEVYPGGREDLGGPLVLRIDEPCEALRPLVWQGARRGAVFITAWNPRSRPQTPEENHAANERLRLVLEGWCDKVLPGRGVSAAGDWFEDSFLAIGLSRYDALTFARKFRQSAIVWVGEDLVPRLELTDPTARRDKNLVDWLRRNRACNSVVCTTCGGSWHLQGKLREQFSDEEAIATGLMAMRGNDVVELLHDQGRVDLALGTLDEPQRRAVVDSWAIAIDEHPMLAAALWQWARQDVPAERLDAVRDCVANLLLSERVVRNTVENFWTSEPGFDALLARIREADTALAKRGSPQSCGLAMLHKLAGVSPARVIASHEPGIEPCRHIGDDMLDA